MGKIYCEVVFFVILCGLSGSLGADTYGISVDGPKCGQKVCKISEYCSDFDGTCQLCSVVCDITSHNYEKTICEKQCQDYLHDIRYVRKTGSGDDDLRGTVQRLSRMLTITLVLVVFMLVVLAVVLCFQLYRWKVKKNITFDVIRSKCFKKASDNNPNTTPTNNQGSVKRELRLEMPSPTANSDHSPVTTTTSISRRPAEDSALDYAAYDNPAMSKIPHSSY